MDKAVEMKAKLGETDEIVILEDGERKKAMRIEEHIDDEELEGAEHEKTIEVLESIGI